MKITIVSLIILVLSIATYCYSKVHEEEVDYCKQVIRLQNRHAHEMRVEGYSLGRIGGELCNDVEKIYIGFYSNKTPTVDEVREDFVKGVECFLKLINNDGIIKPYLHNYPFTIENLKYSLSFPDVPVDASGQGPVVHAFSYKGIIYYSVYDPALVPSRMVHEEPYSEALRIVREARLLPDEHTHK
jgi:hypothetical protein